MDFLPAVCHELKTPLSAIIGFAEELRLEINNPQSVKECLDYVNEINRAALDLSELINDLPDVTNRGVFAVTLDREIDICEAIDKAVKLNSCNAMRKKIMIKTRIADDLGLIRLDNKRMKQVLTNLISNAIKYSDSGTEILVTARRVILKHATALEIEIADHGFGMKNSQILEAFQKYKTVLNPNSGKVDSFGLGLPIVKQLVELQHGEISIKSEISQGTKVKLLFPYSM